MSPQSIFAALGPETAFKLFRYLQSEEKASFGSCLATLASQRKLRPVFVERKRPPERYAWMQKECSRPQNAAMAANLLHIWLAGACKPMLVDFLNALELKHDGEGGIEGLPPEPPLEKVEAAVAMLLEKYPLDEVSAYLRVFQVMEEKGWESLNTILEREPSLGLAATNS